MIWPFYQTSSFYSLSVTLIHPSKECQTYPKSQQRIFKTFIGTNPWSKVTISLVFNKIWQTHRGPSFQVPTINFLLFTDFSCLWELLKVFFLSLWAGNSITRVDKDILEVLIWFRKDTYMIVFVPCVVIRRGIAVSLLVLWHLTALRIFLMSLNSNFSLFYHLV